MNKIYLFFAFLMSIWVNAQTQCAYDTQLLVQFTANANQPAGATAGHKLADYTGSWLSDIKPFSAIAASGLTVNGNTTGNTTFSIPSLANSSSPTNYLYFPITVPANSPIIRMKSFTFNHVTSRTLYFGFRVYNVTTDQLSNFLVSNGTSISSSTTYATSELTYDFLPGNSYQIRMYMGGSALVFTYDYEINDPKINGVPIPIVEDLGILCAGQNLNSRLKNVVLPSAPFTSVKWFNSSGVQLTDAQAIAAPPGTYTARYYNGSCYGPASSVSVQVPNITIDNPPTLNIGQTYKLVKSTNGTFQAMNSNIATVTSDGLVTGVANGDAIVRFTSDIGCITNVNVKVINADLDGDGIQDFRDQDTDNDGITNCVEKGIVGPVTNYFKLNGDATPIAATSGFTLTPKLEQKKGQAWSLNKIDFSRSFEINFQANLGSDINGADGIAIVFHNDPIGPEAEGTTGEGLGAKDIKYGIVLELDTYRNSAESTAPAQHGQIWDSDNGTALSTPIDLGNLKDGNWRNIRVIWDFASKKLSYYVSDDSGNNTILAGSHVFTSGINSYFNNTSKVYFGFTASTGGSTNNQSIRFSNPCNDLPFYVDTDGDGIEDYMDLDSDGDTCFDAIEGAGDIIPSQLNPNGSINSTVDAAGIPIATPGGQGIGYANNPTINFCADLDNDGVPDFLDQDSDNDGISDCIERGIIGDVDSYFKLNGNASKLLSNKFQLTPNSTNQAGQAWSKHKVDFSKSFQIEFQANLGNKVADGADGIAIVFHNDSRGLNTVGTSGYGMGALGIQNGIVLELDTWYNQDQTTTLDPNYDSHGHIWKSSNQQSLSTPIDLGILEDGANKTIKVIWNKAINTLTYYVTNGTNTIKAGELVSSNIASDYFGNSDLVYFGFTASTGSYSNLQTIEFPNPCNNLPFYIDTDGDGIEDYLDNDSDGDGCWDAIEGSGTITPNQVDANGRITGMVNTTTGFPTLVGSGQGNGTSKNFVIVACIDTDGDGILDLYDLDSDNDGILDSVEKGDCSSPFSILSLTGFQGEIYEGNGTINTPTFDSYAEINAFTTFPTANFVKIATFEYYQREKTNRAFDITLGWDDISAGLASRTYKIRNYKGTNFVPSSTNYDQAYLFNKQITADEAGTYRLTSVLADDHVFIYKNGVKIYSQQTAYNDVNKLLGTVDLQAGDILGILLVEDEYANAELNFKVEKISGGTCMLDTDMDGKPDHLDTDADGDGCFDAIEGGGSITSGQLNPDGSINSPVGADGVPTNGGYQSLGTSRNFTQNACADMDGDGVLDYLDLDNDNDGILDSQEEVNCIPQFPPNGSWPAGSTSAKLTNKILFFDWGSAVLRNPSASNNFSNNVSRTITLSNGIKYTATIKNYYAEITNKDTSAATGTVFGNMIAHDVNTYTGAIFKDYYNVNGTTFKEAFYDSAKAKGITNLEVEVIAEDASGKKYPVEMVVFDAETTSYETATANENLILTTNASPFKELETMGTVSGSDIVLDEGNRRVVFNNTSNRLKVYSTTGLTPKVRVYMKRNSSSVGLQGFGVAVILPCDTDNDGIPNYLDNDSDNDGCWDALEGSAKVTTSQVDANGRINTGVDDNGIPTLVSPSGQTGTYAYDPLSIACNFPCYIDPNKSSTGLPTRVGISTIGKPNGWPENRIGGYIALESYKKGFVINKFTTAEIINIHTPVEGMIVYDTTVDCLKIYTKNTDNSYSWKCFDTTACPNY